jgi:hypothetical protein
MDMPLTRGACQYGLNKGARSALFLLPGPRRRSRVSPCQGPRAGREASRGEAEGQIPPSPPEEQPSATPTLAPEHSASASVSRQPSGLFRLLMAEGFTRALKGLRKGGRTLYAFFDSGQGHRRERRSGVSDPPSCPDNARQHPAKDDAGRIFKATRW